VVQILTRKSEKWAALFALRKRGRWLLLLLELRSTGSEKDYDCVYLYPYRNVSLTFESSIAKTVPKRPRKREQPGAGRKLNRRRSRLFTVVSVPSTPG